MPTYDYQCTRCGESFEFFQQMRDEPLSHCAACGGKLRRLIGAGTGVLVKGSAAPPCSAACGGREGGGCGCDPELCHG
jgi:putative FmdB family regulatory protein